ncbi:hypothetical protein DYB36_012427 [Aphanomyces astaci]|uniref:Reverse transcriptase zinc-binding domain-containing protein n=1 Tax=Aphanomyces astaci TaxID=112090 RepID=A0A397A206_APHAT|nr:hypothetical protein DYB36_012427 [Aphanomyces astaci]
MVVSTRWGDTPVYFHNVYAPIPNSLREDYFSSLPRDFPPHAKHFIMGDFNLPMDRLLDYEGEASNHHGGRAECTDWLQSLRVVDAWRIHHPHDRVYSSPHGRNRIDYIFVDTPTMCATYKDAKYFRSEQIAEHMCHSVTLQTTDVQVGRGYWKLPKGILEIPEVTSAIISEARALVPILLHAHNPGVVWAGWKKRTKDFVAHYHAHHIASKGLTVQRAEQDWVSAMAQAARGELTADQLVVERTKLESIKLEWRQHQNDVSFDFYTSNSEVSTSHFFRRPQETVYKVPIATVTTGDGRVSSHPQDIHQAFHTRWSSIMCEGDAAPPNRAARRQFLRRLKTRLTEEQRSELEEPIIPAELASAIKTMAPNKAPGMDGFPPAFFQLDCDTFGHILSIVFAYQLERGVLLGSQRRSAVTLLFKGGERNNPGHYRPISLIPVEVKALSRALTHRLRTIIPLLIHPLELVDDFCAVSGARLNRSKCKVVLLNSKMTVPHHPRLKVVPTKVPIRYLGILFGHDLSDQTQVHEMEDKLLASFLKWGCRARTLQGRRLLVNTMILSQLWHYTAVIPVTQATLRKWQAMVLKFILGRKLRHGEHFIQLLHSGWAYHRTLGLRVPHIPSMVQYQRVLRLQLLVQSDLDSELWTAIPKYHWHQCLVPFTRQDKWDALLYEPNWRTPLLRLDLLPPFWRDVWVWWARLPVESICIQPPAPSQLLTMSIWFQRHPLFLVKGSKTEMTCLAIALRKHRSWSRHLASCGLHCLGDLLTPSRHWPTLDQFQRRMLDFAETFDELEERPVTFRHSYVQLSTIAQRVWEVMGLALDKPVPFTGPSESEVGASVLGIPMGFAHWPRKYTKTICFHAAQPTKPHPMATASRNTEAHIRSYIKTQVKPTLAPLPPLLADVWLRILYRMIPVSYRYFFLQHSNPHIVECAYPGCSAVENSFHAFFDCPNVSPLWDLHTSAWTTFGKLFQWDLISNLDDLPITLVWAPHSVVITKLWALLVSVTLRALWITRNHIKFQGKTPTPVMAQIEVTLVTWCACVRRWLRSLPVGDADRTDLLAILAGLQQAPGYSWFFKYPRALEVSRWHSTL